MLIMATRSGRSDVVKPLLKAGAALNLQNKVHIYMINCCHRVLCTFCHVLQVAKNGFRASLC